MTSHYSHLGLNDRRKIFQMLGRHRSTVYRELGRNRVQPERANRPFRYWEHQQNEGYYPVSANTLALPRRSRQCKLIRLSALRDHVINKLQAAWSPEQIAGRLRQTPEIGLHISHETIYRFAYSADGRAAKPLLAARAQSGSPINTACHQRLKGFASDAEPGLSNHQF